MGAGGAAKALYHGLSGEGARVTVVNRNKERAFSLVNPEKDNAITYDELDPGMQYDLIVNATPCGKKGFDPMAPIPEALIRSDQVVYDIVYNPEVTPLLKLASEKDAKTVKGMGMLAYQGAEAFKIWTGREPDAEAMLNAAREALP